MPRRAWITFVVRNLYLMNIGILCQMGVNSGVRNFLVLFLYRPLIVLFIASS